MLSEQAKACNGRLPIGLRATESFRVADGDPAGPDNVDPNVLEWAHPTETHDSVVSAQLPVQVQPTDRWVGCAVGRFDSVAFMECAVVAFELTGDPLLEGNPIVLREGATIFYGGNGAGKTRLLRGIRNALQGVASASHVTLVVRAVASDADARRGESGLWRPHFGIRPIQVAIAQSISSGVASGSRGAPVSERRMSASQAAEVIEEHIRWEAGDSDPALLSELLESRLFLLAPTGTVDAPSWDAWPVADLNLPEAKRSEAEVADRYQAANSYGSDDSEEMYEAYQEWIASIAFVDADGIMLEPRRPRHRMLTPRGYSPYSVGMNNMFGADGIDVVGPVDFGLDVVEFDRPAAEVTSAYIADIVAGSLEANADMRHDDSVAMRPPALPEHASTPERLARYEARARPPDAQRRLELPALWAGVRDIVEAVADELSAAVNETLESVLLDPPVARMDVADPALSLARNSAIWRFSRPRYGQREVEFEGLSHAERLWAERAIHDAVYWHRRDQTALKAPSLRPALYIYDEPEAALHRAAEANMAESLLRSATDPRRVYLVATHSPELLDTLSTNLIEVQRNGYGDRSRVHALDLGDREDLAGLGLMPSDLLRWQRVFLLVEGEHDEVLIKHFLGDRLRRARVEIVPVRGAVQFAHAIDSRVLFDFTGAHLLALVDNQRADVIRDAWSDAQLDLVKDGVDVAVKRLVERVDNRSDEARVILQWLTGALKKNLASRVSAHGLEKKDIIHYLPVERLVPGATSWESLIEQHARERDASPAKTPRDFKSWLRARFMFDDSPTVLVAAAQGVQIPKDFQELMNELEALAEKARS